MRKVVPLNSNHPLVGTWCGEGDDSRAEYTVSATPEGFSVAGVDSVDGEQFVISEVSWDGERLAFSSLMPSTGRRGKNVFRLISEDQIEYTFTFTETEIWRKKA